MIKISASFDDGCASDVNAARLLLKYNVPATFYLPVNYIGLAEANGYKPISGQTINTLKNNFKIGSHTVMHSLLTRISPEAAWSEISESKTMLEDILGIRIDSFCYPRGYANDQLREMVRKAGYKTARNTLVGNLDPPVDPVWITPAVHIAGKRRPEYENTTWYDEGMRLIKVAKEKAKRGEEVDFHIWGHSWEIDRYKAWGEFESFLKELSKL